MCPFHDQLILFSACDEDFCQECVAEYNAFMEANPTKVPKDKVELLMEHGHPVWRIVE